MVGGAVSRSKKVVRSVVVAACIVVLAVSMQASATGDEGGPPRLARYLAMRKEERERIKVLAEAGATDPALYEPPGAHSSGAAAELTLPTPPSASTAPHCRRARQLTYQVVHTHRPNHRPNQPPTPP